MSYGIEFETNQGKIFSLADIQPIVFIGRYTLTGNQTITAPGFNNATLYPELLARQWVRSGNGQVSSHLRYSFNNSSAGLLTVSFSNINIASFWADFAVYARFD